MGKCDSKQPRSDSRPGAVAPGMYHYRLDEGERHLRAHLRVEGDGSGLLVLDASRIIHLNSTAALMAKLVLEQVEPAAAARRLRRVFRARGRTLAHDFERVRLAVTTLREREDVCPFTYLGVEMVEPFQVELSAPYRMDLALTYACDNDCEHCYVPGDRRPAELTAEQWRQVLARLWALGVPHVCFTGGEATLRPDLVQLVERAEDIGMVTGLITNGRRLSADLVGELVAAGLDHVQITLESHDARVHNAMVGCDAWAQTVAGIKQALAAPLFVVTNTTITRDNAAGLEPTLEFLCELGVRNFACNSLIYSGGGAASGKGLSEGELAPRLERLRDRAVALGMRFVWYTPTRYCDLDPVNLGLGPKRCTAAKENMCIEPDGQVIPCQSCYQGLGNILGDDWEDIWNHASALALRNREWAPDECRACARFPNCGGGCPLHAQAHGYLCVESKSSG
ncbi:MAG TPA: radical SAM protein [Armatimonadota bacterium]|nr:radical SAM protein [Armatimonadota bacterium]